MALKITASNVPLVSSEDYKPPGWRIKRKSVALQKQQYDKDQNLVCGILRKENSWIYVDFEGEYKPTFSPHNAE